MDNLSNETLSSELMRTYGVNTLRKGPRDCEKEQVERLLVKLSVKLISEKRE